jgi:hypothetical protein
VFVELLASARQGQMQTPVTPATPPTTPQSPVFSHDLPNVTLEDREVTVS